jgi:hypothetical protein
MQTVQSWANMLSVKCVLDLIKISQFIVTSVWPFLRFLYLCTQSKSSVLKWPKNQSVTLCLSPTVVLTCITSSLYSGGTYHVHWRNRPCSVFTHFFRCIVTTFENATATIYFICTGPWSHPKDFHLVIHEWFKYFIVYTSLMCFF